MEVRTPRQNSEPVDLRDLTSNRMRRLGGFGNMLRAFGSAAVLSAGVAACSDFSRQATRPASEAADAGYPDAGEGEGDAGVDDGTRDAQAPDAQLPDAQVPDAAPPPGDSDGDGVTDDKDPCEGGLRPDTLNPVTGQARDSDNDGVVDGCDNCVGTANAGQEDQDGDLVGNACDNAPGVSNPSQSDLDNDGRGDAIDGCPDHPDDGTDNDADGSPPPCDCDDGDASVHPGANDQACDDRDANCDSVGKVSVTFPDSTVVIPGEPNCECVTGAARVNPQGLQAPCAGAQEVCVSDGAGGSHFQTQVPAVLPTPEVEDNADNDCDGAIDEGFECDGGQNQPCGVGACAGEQACVGGHWGACDGGAPSTDICNSGVDDDCTGVGDDAYGTGNPCVGERGVCAGVPGVIVCKNELEAACSSDPGGADSPALATDPCDGVDNDCDGVMDEDQYVGGFKNELCQGVGNCAFPGLNECFGPNAVACSSETEGRGGLNPGMLESAQGNPPGSLCDGQDNDCDGVQDDGCGCAPNGPAFECGIETGACQKGVISCVNGALEEVCAGQNFVGPTPEVCDSVDTDCDGRRDNLPEGNAGDPCQGAGACGDVSGFKECFVDANGASHIRCDTMPGGSFDQSSQEICDDQGRDENCDGQSNEGNWAGAGAVNQPCALPGLCEGVQGHTRCVTDQATECSAIDNAIPGPEFLGPGNPNNRCDGVDQNCSGAADENCPCVNPVVCGDEEGICDPGFQACNNGTLSQECVGDIGPEPTEKCDGLDNDCDGVTDDGFGILDANGQQVTCELPLPCGQGIMQCKPDGSAAICSAIAAATQEVCGDAIDNDCDGKADANDDQGCVQPQP